MVTGPPRRSTGDSTDAPRRWTSGGALRWRRWVRRGNREAEPRRYLRPGWLRPTNVASSPFGASVAKVAPTRLAAPGITTTLPAPVPATAALATSGAETHI